MNELEAQGVFRRPEDLKVVVEYLNSFFLVKKGKSRLLSHYGLYGGRPLQQTSTVAYAWR